MSLPPHEMAYGRAALALQLLSPEQLRLHWQRCEQGDGSLRGALLAAGLLGAAEDAQVRARLAGLAHSGAETLVADVGASARPSTLPRRLPGPGERVAGYLLERELGRGGAGAVFAARDPGGAPCALKLLLGDLERGDARARFRREADIGRRLRHPHVVRVLDAGEDDGVAYLAMELLEGARPLNTYADAEGLGPAARAELVASVAEAVQAAHEEGLVHRDLKPDNVLVDAAGRMKVVDFGLARDLAATRLTASGAIMGTVAYMAPEQVEGQTAHANPSTDVWALGVLLYELIAGSRPFRGGSTHAVMLAIVKHSPAPLAQVAPGASAGLEPILAKALAKRPEDRYAQAGELARDLRALLGDSGQTAAARARRRRAVRLAGALAGGLLLLGGLWGLRGRSAGGDPEPPPPAAAPAVALSLAPVVSRTTTILDCAEMQGSVAGGPVQVELRVDGAPVDYSGPWTSFRCRVPLPRAGPNRVELVAVDAEDRRHVASWTVTRRYSSAPPLDLPGLTLRPATEDFLNERDGSVMVWIPSGSFDLGSDDDRLLGFLKGESVKIAAPVQRDVQVRGFFLGKHEISGKQFQRFLEEHPEFLNSEGVGKGGPSLPAIYMTWTAARAYCRWAGGDLPSEVQWEYAARGPENRLYSWGDAPPGPFWRRKRALRPVTESDDGVGIFGCLNMLGNVREWTLDDLSIGYAQRTTGLPAHSEEGLVSLGKVVRGERWSYDPVRLQLAMRTCLLEVESRNDVGIRLCRNLPPVREAR